MKALYIILTLGIFNFDYSDPFLEKNIPDKETIKNKAIIAKAFAQWQNGKASFFDLLSENIEWTVAGSGNLSGIYKGKQNFINNAVIPINNQLATKIKPEIISLTAEGSVVWLHWKGKAIAKSGAIYKNEYAWKLELEGGKIVRAIAFLDSKKLDQLLLRKSEIMKPTMEDSKEYLGMWITEDGNIRHELLPGNRYDEARGNRKSAYQGSYIVRGNHIDYRDDTGFSADGEFKEGILYHGGMVLYKDKNK